MAPGTSSYFLPPAAAAAINVACILFHLSLRLRDDVIVEWTISLGSAVWFSLPIFFIALSSFLDRYHRLIVFYPVAVMIFSFLLPMRSVWTQPKMKVIDTFIGKKRISSKEKSPCGGGIAKIFRFSPTCPWFDSRLSEELYIWIDKRH